VTLATSDSGGTASGGDGDDELFGSDTSFGNFDNSLQGDAGNDDLHAGAVGSAMNGGSGSDRLFSSAADDQMEAGRDDFETTITLDRGMITIFENFGQEGRQPLRLCELGAKLFLLAAVLSILSWRAVRTRAPYLAVRALLATLGQLGRTQDAQPVLQQFEDRMPKDPRRSGIGSEAYWAKLSYSLGLT
jgi:hypothetical protein